MSKQRKQIIEIAVIGVMAALAVVLDILSFPKGESYLKFTLYGLPLMFVGCIYGGKIGLICGVVAGFIMQLLYGLTPEAPLWMLAPIAWGGISGLTFYLLKRKNRLLNLFIVSFVTSIMATLSNTVAMLVDALIIDQYYTLASIIANLPPRLISMVILGIIYAFILWILIKRLSFLSIDTSEDN